MLNLQVITKDIITGALDGSMTIDNRIFTSDGRSSIANDFKNLDRNLATSITGAVLNLTDAISTIAGQITSDKKTCYIINY